MKFIKKIGAFISNLWKSVIGMFRRSSTSQNDVDSEAIISNDQPHQHPNSHVHHPLNSKHDSIISNTKQQEVEQMKKRRKKIIELENKFNDKYDKIKQIVDIVKTKLEGLIKDSKDHQDSVLIKGRFYNYHYNKLFLYEDWFKTEEFDVNEKIEHIEKYFKNKNIIIENKLTKLQQFGNKLDEITKNKKDLDKYEKKVNQLKTGKNKKLEIILTGQKKLSGTVSMLSKLKNRFSMIIKQFSKNQEFVSINPVHVKKTENKITKITAKLNTKKENLNKIRKEFNTRKNIHKLAECSKTLKKYANSKDTHDSLKKQKKEWAENVCTAIDSFVKDFKDVQKHNFVQLCVAFNKITTNLDEKKTNVFTLRSINLCGLFKVKNIINTKSAAEKHYDKISNILRTIKNEFAILDNNEIMSKRKVIAIKEGIIPQQKKYNNSTTCRML